MPGLGAVASKAVASLPALNIGLIDVNPPNIGRFYKTTFRLLPSLRQNVPLEFIVPNEANPHFIGKFHPIRFQRFPYASYETDTPQPETNVHFLGRFKQTQFQIRSALRQDYPTHDIQPETNPHFIGRFVASKHRINWSLRQLGALDLGTDFPQYFLGKFVPVHHQILLRLRQNAHEDSIAAYVQVIEAAHAVDQEFTIIIPPQPGCPVIGPGVGSNPSVTGPGPC